MFTTILNNAIKLVAKLLVDIDPRDLDKIKNAVIYYEDKILPNPVKHGEVVKVVHEVVHTASGTVIDFLIKLCIIWVRKLAA